MRTLAKRESACIFLALSVIVMPTGCATTSTRTKSAPEARHVSASTTSKATERSPTGRSATNDSAATLAQSPVAREAKGRNSDGMLKAEPRIPEKAVGLSVPSYIVDKETAVADVELFESRSIGTAKVRTASMLTAEEAAGLARRLGPELMRPDFTALILWVVGPESDDSLARAEFRVDRTLVMSAGGETSNDRW